MGRNYRRTFILLTVLAVCATIVFVPQMQYTSHLRPNQLLESNLVVGDLSLPETSVLHYSGVSFSQNDRSKEVTKVNENLEKCFQVSGLSNWTRYQDIKAQAKWNAEYFMREYRRVIPQRSLQGYSSYCWRTNYTALAPGWFSRRVEGHIGGLIFNSETDKRWYGEDQYSDLANYFGGRFSSDLVCLPKTYILGFEKCGSTFFWCFIAEVVNGFRANGGHSLGQFQAGKEQYFWTPFDYEKTLPHAYNIGNPYLLNFMRSFDSRLSSNEQKKIVLIDGTPATVIEWPNFKESDNEMANYCLLPSALPQLLPQSKYLIIVRNPVSMMYSNFWWTYNYRTDFKGWQFIHDLLYSSDGPDVFHRNVISKIDSFLECLRDKASPLTSSPCPFMNSSNSEYKFCINTRLHLLSECVYSITTERVWLEAALHRGIYYVHVRKWLSVLPKERIMFMTLEKLRKSPALVAMQVLEFLEVDGTPVDVSDDQVKKVTSSCSTNTNHVFDYKGDPKLDMHIETKEILNKFFEPFNELLSDLLNDSQFSWGT